MSVLKPYGVTACLTYVLKVFMLALEFFKGTFSFSLLSTDYFLKMPSNYKCTVEDTVFLSIFLLCNLSPQ